MESDQSRNAPGTSRERADPSGQSALAAAIPDGARTLPSRWYTSPVLYEIDRSRIFHASWQCIGPIDWLRNSGDYLTAEVAGEPVVVVRGNDGQLRGFRNVCRHRAGAPAVGRGCARVLRCNYHGWAYDLTGTLVGAPELSDVEERGLAGLRLEAVRVAVWEPFVFVNLAADTPDLAASLSSLPARLAEYRLGDLRFGHRVEYLIACNWKVYVDNFLEGYHIPHAHPGLHRAIDYANYTIELSETYSVQYGPRRDGRPPARIRDGLTGRNAAGSNWCWVFPNLMVNLHPMGMSSNQILPLAHDRTLTIFDFYWEDVDPAAGPREHHLADVAESDVIQREDIAICESVQRGLRSSAYDTGTFCQAREAGVYHFHQLLRAVYGPDANAPETSTIAL